MTAPQPVRILISHVYSSHNNGDAAILSAQIAELQRVFGKPLLTILSIDAIPAGYRFDDVPVFNSLMFDVVKPGRSKLVKLLRAGVMMTYTLLWAMVYRQTGWRLYLPKSWRRPMRLLQEANMQVCVGGGYLRAKADTASTVLLALLCHQIWLAKLLRKPVYLYAQSFGPYPRNLQQKIAAFSLKRVDLILVRESKSEALLRALGVSDSRVRKVPDSAFLFQPKSRLDAKSLLDRREPDEQLVGITARAWLKPAAQKKYEAALADFINRTRRLPHYRVVLIAQVTSELQNDDDREVGRRLEHLVGQHDNVIFLDQRFSHYDIKAIFSRLDYLVGTRFHSVIFALTAGVPALAIEYEHKTSGIMHDLGLEEWTLPIEDVTGDRLWELFERLRQARAAYRRQLQDVIPPYEAEARRSAELIRQAYAHAADGGSAAPAPHTS